MIKVKNRKGDEVAFDETRVYNAIKKAFIATYGDEAEEESINAIKDDVMYSLDMIVPVLNVIPVETIQDIVEERLMNKEPQVARNYIRYRYLKNITRLDNDIIESIVEADSNDITKENANMSADTMSGELYKIASVTLQRYTDECQLNPITKKALEANLIHIHDKDCYATKSLTCVQTPLDKILKNGLHCNHAECRSPKRILTAAILAVMSLQTSQNEMHKFCAA